MERLRKTFFIVLLLIVSMCFNMQESFAETTLDCTPSLKNGAVNDKSQVKILQKELNAVMGCGLTVDGAFGSKTESCVKSFQAEYKLTKDGKAGPSTCKKLDEVYKKTTNTKEDVEVESSDLICSSSNILKRGSKGKQVEYLQKKLNKTMGCGLAVDGSFGGGTENCVKSFQTEYKLTIDGKVGENTCKKLNEVSEKNTTSKEDFQAEPNDLTCSRTLESKSKGKEVEYLQKKLNEVMGCELDIDGSFGLATENCVNSFQIEYELEYDGKVGPETCKKLNEVYEDKINPKKESANLEITTSTTLKKGSSGTQVKILQKMLNKTTHCNLNVTGKFDSRTEWCVKQYQREHELSVDGKIGSKTRTHINNYFDNYVEKSMVIITKKTDVRKESKAGSKYLGYVSTSEVYVILGTNNMNGTKWYKIEYQPGKYGYISSVNTSKNFIKLDISSQNLKLYRAGKEKLNVPVVTGDKLDKTTTPIGIYEIGYMNDYTKNEANNPIYLPKYTSKVYYWMSFKGDYGFHDATWRSTSQLTNPETYLKNGSHGCVNMSPRDARYLYKNVYAHLPVHIVE